jgi:hypothetical protein
MRRRALAKTCCAQCGPQTFLHCDAKTIDVRMLIETVLTGLFVAFGIYAFTRILKAYRSDRYW